jgi:hypothetical protein
VKHHIRPFIFLNTICRFFSFAAAYLTSLGHSIDRLALKAGIAA